MAPRGTSEPTLCGATYPSAKGQTLTCIKEIDKSLVSETNPSGHKDGKEGHASRGRAFTRTFAPVKSAVIAEDIDDSVHVVFTTATETRPEIQVEIDGYVSDLYQKWVAAGKPEFTRKSLSSLNCKTPRKRLLMDPADTEAIDTYVDRAASYLGVTVVKAPVMRHESGNAMLYFAVRDPRTGDKSTDEPEQDEPDTSDEPDASQENSEMATATAGDVDGA